MKHSPGFTLVEVLVTIALLATGIVTALGVVRSSQASVERTAEHQQASQVAETLMTEIRLGLVSAGDTGQSGRYAWAIESSGPCWNPVSAASSGADSLQRDCELQPVVITVSWGTETRRSHVRVETLARA